MKWPSKEELNSINMQGVLDRTPNNDKFKVYINELAGMEHYRLLVWLGFQFSFESLIEVGVSRGISGCALSHNTKNKVTGFDLIDNISCHLPANYTFIIGDILLNERLVKNSPFVMYDTDHTGVHEKIFYEWLVKINYKGLILFDDIHLNSEMVAFWESISHKKEDISSIGHITGTGVVWM